MGCRPARVAARTRLRLGGLAALVATASVALSWTTAAVATTGVEPASEDAVTQPLVVAGIGGLGWDEVSPERTPALWSLLERGASAAAITVHTAGLPACPEGGWLSIGAGRAVSSHRFAGGCLSLPAVEATGQGAGTVAGWGRLVLDQLGSTYQPQLGTLAASLATAEVCATAVGPGAALTLAGPSGQVGRYRSALTQDAFDCPLTVVDLGSTSVLDDVNGGRLAADEALAELVAAIPEGTGLLVTSVSSPSGGRLELGVTVLDRGLDQEAELLSSPSTRRAGVVRLLDLPATIVSALRVPEPGTFDGSPVAGSGPREPSADLVRDLADISVADLDLRAATTPLLNGLGAVALALVAVAALWLRRRAARTTAAVGSAAGRRALEVGLLFLAAMPVASYLVTLLRWWRYENPTAALWIGMVLIAGVLAAVVAAVARRPTWRPVLGLAGVTCAVLVLDGLAGTPLHWGSPLGTSAVLGNRYYGFGNSTFAVLAVHALLLAGALATPLVSSGRHRAAVLAVLGVAAVTVAVDIGPTWGADVGGGLALVPAFALLALAAGGARLTPVRVAVALGSGLVVVAGVAMLDWLRPAAQRSHAGRFVQLVLDGEAWELLLRKLGNAAASFDRGVVPWITVVVVVLVIAVLGRPERFAPRPVEAAMASWPLLRATLIAIVVTAVLGSLVNDWGVRVATVVLTAALPLAAVACLRATVSAPGPEAVPEAVPEAGQSRPLEHREPPRHPAPASPRARSATAEQLAGSDQSPAIVPTGASDGRRSD